MTFPVFKIEYPFKAHVIRNSSRMYLGRGFTNVFFFLIRGNAEGEDASALLLHVITDGGCDLASKGEDKGGGVEVNMDAEVALLW